MVSRIELLQTNTARDVGFHRNYPGNFHKQGRLMQSKEQDQPNGDIPIAETEELPPETLPKNFSVSIPDWENDNESETRKFAEGMLYLTKDLSRYLDLSRLESLVVACDYAKALADIDRGGSLPPARPTVNEYGQGKAMAVKVVRGNQIWSVVVIWAGLVRWLNEVDHPEYKRALQIFVHELVHVDDLQLFMRTYPGGWQAAKPRDGRDANLQPIVNPCQSEYSAQRRSAWAAPEYGLDLLEMLDKAMKDVESQIRSARLRYRLHGDIKKFWSVVTERLVFLFQAIGYALGHADWVEENADDYPELAVCYRTKLKELAEYSSGWMLAACRDAVQPFFYLDKWTGQEIYDPLIEVLERFLNQNGIYTRTHGDGMYIDVP